MLGANSAIPEQAIAPGDVIAVYNLGPGQNDAYLADNTATVKTVSTANPANITLLTAKKFPFASGSNRFHVIPKGELVVAYVCGGDSLYRTSSSTFTSACPTTGAVLANKVKPGSCSFVFDPSQQRNALVQVSLSFTDKGETVNLYHDVHVDNTP
jgi:MSHA biogenesis protein MshO